MRTTRGYRFTPKNLNKILKNRAYIGEYSYGGYVIEDGMARLVEDDVFEEVQRRFAINKRRGAKTKAELAAQGDDAPDYWLTGHAYCLTCGGPMEGVSGTSKTGRKYRYYYCLNQRKKQCTAKTVRKDEIEARVEEIVESFLAEPDMLASLAVDLADHYKQTHGRGDEILKALEARRTDVEAKLVNFVKAISQGIFNSITADAMNALEAQKTDRERDTKRSHVPRCSICELGGRGCSRDSAGSPAGVQPPLRDDFQQAAIASGERSLCSGALTVAFQPTA
ncbi:recombinase zinc beta ribbon domain-containing protein [Buchananella felis]|uniref:recombinase zinc beta ribbon domain-containing protein n=1 Tax=Buchananella felis TaxID=3231492 RepID=UPI003526F744